MVATVHREKHIQNTSFEESDFKGIGFWVDCLRWWRQFLALTEKNLLIYKRRPIYSLSSLLVPSLAVFIFFLGNANLSTSSSSTNTLQAPTTLQGLGLCDAYNLGSSCLQIAYAPTDESTNEVMQHVSEYNELDFNNDMKGFQDFISLQVQRVFLGMRLKHLYIIIFHVPVAVYFIHLCIFSLCLCLSRHTLHLV